MSVKGGLPHPLSDTVAVVRCLFGHCIAAT